MTIIEISDRRRMVVGLGVKKDGDDWVPDDTKARVSFQKLKDNTWVPAKGLQFDKGLKDKIASALSNL